MLSSKLTSQGLFQKTLADVLRKLRSSSSTAAEEAMLPNIVEEIKKEITSPVTTVKVIAIQKALYFSMLGYSTEFAFFPIVEIMADRNFGNKRLAYMAASLLFTENADVIPLTTGLLLRDLQNGSNSHHQGLALGFLSNVCTPDLARDVVSYVVQMLDTHRYPPALRKKAVMCLYKLFLDFPEALRLVYLQLKDKIDDSSENKDDHPGVRSAVVCVLCELVRRMPATYLGLAIPLYSLLSTIEGNWGLIKIVKMFAYLIPHEPRLVKKLTAPFEKLLSHTKAVSVKYECYRTIATTDLATVPSLAAFTVDGLKIFLQSRDQNLRFMGLEALSLLAFRCSSALHTSTSACVLGLLRPLRKIVMHCLDDKDITIRRKAALILRETTGEKQLFSTVMELSASMHYVRRTSADASSNGRRGEMWEEKDELDEEDAEEVNDVTLAGGGRRIRDYPHGKGERHGKWEEGGTLGRRLPQLVENSSSSSSSTEEEGPTSQRRIVRRWMNEVVGCIVDVVRREDYIHLSDVEWYLAVLLKLFQDFMQLSPAAEFRVGHLLKEEVLQLVLRVPEARSFAVEALVQGLLLSPSFSSSVVPFSFFFSPALFPLAPPPPLSSWWDSSCRESPAEPRFSRRTSPPSDTTRGVDNSSSSMLPRKEVWRSGEDRKPKPPQKKKKNDLLPPFVLSSSSTVMSGWHVVAAATLICGEYGDPSTLFTTLVDHTFPPLLFPTVASTPTRPSLPPTFPAAPLTPTDAWMGWTSSWLCLCARWCHPTLRQYPPSLQCTCLWAVGKMVSKLLCLSDSVQAVPTDDKTSTTIVKKDEKPHVSKTSDVSCASSALSSMALVETLAERWWTTKGDPYVTAFFLTSPYPRVASTARIILGILYEMVKDRRADTMRRERGEKKGSAEGLRRPKARNWFFTDRSLQPAVSWGAPIASVGDAENPVWLLSPLHVGMKTRRKITKGTEEECRPLHTSTVTTTMTVDMSAFLCPAIEEMLLFTEDVEEEEGEEEEEEEEDNKEGHPVLSGKKTSHATRSTKRSPAWRQDARMTHTTLGSSLLSRMVSRTSPIPSLASCVFPPELQRPLTSASLRGERRMDAWRKATGSAPGASHSPHCDAAIAPYYLDDKEDEDEAEERHRQPFPSRGGEVRRRTQKKPTKKDGEGEDEAEEEAVVGVPSSLWLQTGHQRPSRVHPHTGSKVPRMGSVLDKGVGSRTAVSEGMDGREDDEEDDVVTRRLRNVDIRRALTKEDVLPRTAPTYEELFRMAEEAKRHGREKKEKKAVEPLRSTAENQEEGEDGKKEQKKRRKEKKHKKHATHHDKKRVGQTEDERKEAPHSPLPLRVPPTSSSSSALPYAVPPSSSSSSSSSLPYTAWKERENLQPMTTAESTTTAGTVVVLCDHGWVKVQICPIPPVSFSHAEMTCTTDGEKEPEENQGKREEEQKRSERQAAWPAMHRAEGKGMLPCDPRYGMAELVCGSSSGNADDHGRSASPRWWSDTQSGMVAHGDSAVATTTRHRTTTCGEENSRPPDSSTVHAASSPFLELCYDVSVTFMPCLSERPPAEGRNPDKKKRDTTTKKQKKEQKEEKEEGIGRGRSRRKNEASGVTNRILSPSTLGTELGDECSAWAAEEEDCSKWVMTHIHLALFADEQTPSHAWFASPLPCTASTGNVVLEGEERSAQQECSTSPSSPQWRLLPMVESSETTRIVDEGKRIDSASPWTFPSSSLSMLYVVEKLRPQETAHVKCRIQTKTPTSASLLSAPVPFTLLYQRGSKKEERENEMNHTETNGEMEENRAISVRRDMQRLSVPFFLPFHHLRPSLRFVKEQMQPISSMWSSSSSPSQIEGRDATAIPLGFPPLTEEEDSPKEKGSNNGSFRESSTSTLHVAPAPEVELASSSLSTSYVYRCYRKEIDESSSVPITPPRDALPLQHVREGIEHVVEGTPVSPSNSLPCPLPAEGKEKRQNKEAYDPEEAGDAIRREGEGGEERIARGIAEEENEMTTSVEGRNEKMKTIVSEVVWTEATDLLLSIPRLQIELGLQAMEVFSTAMTLCTVVLGSRESCSCHPVMMQQEMSYVAPVTLTVFLRKEVPREEESTAKHNLTECSPASNEKKRRVEAECSSSLVVFSTPVKKENHSPPLPSRSSERFPISVTVCCVDRRLLQDALHRIVQTLVQCAG